MQKYCLVKLLEDLNEGDEFTAINYWPLHVTLASNFIVDWEKTGLFDTLSELLSGVKPVNALVGQDEFFGRERNVRVSLLAMSPELMSLHKRIVRTLRGAGAIFDEPQFNDDDYRAHATVQKAHRLHKGDTILIDEVTIVDMFPHGDITKRRILKTVKLSGK